MNRVLQIIQLLLTIWGGISLVGIGVLAGYILYLWTLENKTVVDKATKSDVTFVLNWCELGDQRIDKVLNSYVSARSFTGDHLDAYAIKITDVTVDELINNKHNKAGLWYRGDNLPPVLDDAVSFISGWSEKPAWFPTKNSIRTQDFYVYPRSIHYHEIKPTAAFLIFIKPAEKTVYYIEAEI
ncbi:hypothetical protein FACS189454_01860 [Planctomycetales bacterium]|nr:hypothetical protein FACS189454_01860 [Planctomycetales bacterium]